MILLINYIVENWIIMNFLLIFYIIVLAATFLQHTFAQCTFTTGNIANGGDGDCVTSLADGSTCQPVCSAGYKASGEVSCSGTTLTNTFACT